MGATFQDAEDLGNIVLDLYQAGARCHLAFLNAAMAPRSLEGGHVLFGACPEERPPRLEPALKRASKSHRGRVAPREEVERVWEQRFFPAGPLGRKAEL